MITDVWKYRGKSRHIVVDIDGVNITELINKAAENGYSLRVVDDRDSTETPATYASPHQLL
ncbi:DUF5983 family protein [Escherichia coli]|uniref:DUF5983 family protein n=1 Tax=Escherichia coli TaxID=562 RepID=UPI00190CF180|nr:DUF5983 family protein [Escherichia coli]MBK2798407.1 hypothetical protein [Escherichia coli]HDY1070933.1 hypothetical protein [Escherichia coli]